VCKLFSGRTQKENLMRRSLAPLAAALLAVSACGSGSHTATVDTLSPAAVIRAAAVKAAAGSSKLDMSIDTKAQGQHVTMSGIGVFGYSGSSVVGSMMLTFNGAEIEERITGGNLYLKVPGQVGFFKLALADLVGTQLAQSSNPGSSAELLKAIGDSVKKVGTEPIRGVTTTHYSGTVTVADAAAKLKGGIASLGLKKLQDSGVTEIPVEVYLDDQGRLRRLTENVTVVIKGVAAQVATRMDFYDFGTKVDVQTPPADQVKDGSALLKALKSQLGGG